MNSRENYSAHQCRRLVLCCDFQGSLGNAVSRSPQALSLSIPVPVTLAPWCSALVTIKFTIKIPIFVTSHYLSWRI